MLPMIKIITSYGEFYGDPSFVTELTDMIFEILPTGCSTTTLFYYTFNIT